MGEEEQGRGKEMNGVRKEEGGGKKAWWGEHEGAAAECQVQQAGRAEWDGLSRAGRAVACWLTHPPHPPTNSPNNRHLAGRPAGQAGTHAISPAHPAGRQA